MPLQMPFTTTLKASSDNARMGFKGHEIARMAGSSGWMGYAGFDLSPDEMPAGYDDHYILRSIGTGAPLPNIAYAIQRATVAVEHDTSDAQGRTHLLVQTLECEHIHVYIEDSK